MKKSIFVMLIAALGLTAPAFAQDSLGKKIGHGAEKAWKGTKKVSSKAWRGTKKGASAAGNKTAEVASKGKAAVTDKKSEDWVGPKGQTIYVTDDNRYYWVNGRGKRMFVAESALSARNKKE